ncbi:hypothetical protein QQS21_010348 [Conoideocrella luteorostrata]|uniref:Uncharacterized protein n=1 Tax=Conoideocrella luteorostrata TaxID=1105319 RepID=A0AAJ0FU98_9HYPO|nr:hypothetical protein QQS21_010348 [Conoideocrella luteorostrata]
MGAPDIDNNSANAAKEGGLLCSLHADHGFRDAVQEMLFMAAMTSGSLGIGQSDWLTTRASAFTNGGGQPAIHRFALYNNGDKDSFLKIAEAVDFGLQYVIAGSHDKQRPLKRDNLDELIRYTAIELEDEHSTDELCEQH